MENIDLDEPFDFSTSGTGTGDMANENVKKLFPAAEITLNQALAILFAWFCAFPGVSKEAFSQLLYLLHTFLLPSENILPASYIKSLAIINRYLVPFHEYDCCINNCIVYRNSGAGKFQEFIRCPICGEERFQSGLKIA